MMFNLHKSFEEFEKSKLNRRIKILGKIANPIYVSKSVTTYSLQSLENHLFTERLSFAILVNSPPPSSIKNSTYGGKIKCSFFG